MRTYIWVAGILLVFIGILLLPLTGLGFLLVIVGLILGGSQAWQSCPNCGALQPGMNKYCRKCGESLRESKSED